MPPKKSRSKSRPVSIDIENDEVEVFEDEVPTLTDIVTPGSAPPPEATLTAMQAEITARTLKLAEELLHNATREVEAVLLERVRDQLKSALPDIIDETLRARLQKTLK